MTDSKMVQVVALKPCFTDGQIRKIGDIFNVTADQLKEVERRQAEKVKAGSKVARPVYKAAPDTVAAAAEAARIVKAAEDRQRAGAIAASGGPAAREKVKSLAEQIGG
jgi:hypothetical protein